jgi:hypothetical protein
MAWDKQTILIPLMTFSLRGKQTIRIRLNFRSGIYKMQAFRLQERDTSRS